MSRLVARAIVGLALCLFAFGTRAVAQESFPSSTITFAIGFPPGATADTTARLLARKLSEQMKTSVIVQNMPGANGDIAGSHVANAKPNGYTLLMAVPSILSNPAFGVKSSYHVFKDLTPVSLVARGPFILMVSAKSPIHTVQDLVAYIKANPGKVSYGSSGEGSSAQLAAGMLLQTEHLTATHVPYKGAADSETAVVSGEVQFTFGDLTSSLNLAKAGRVTLLASTSSKRSAVIPDVPTLAETVMPDFDLETWGGVLAPAKTSPAIVAKLQREIATAL